MQPPVNVLRATLHPEGLAPRWPVWYAWVGFVVALVGMESAVLSWRSPWNCWVNAAPILSFIPVNRTESFFGASNTLIPRWSFGRRCFRRMCS